MTPQEINTEWRYRYEERLGILTGGALPTYEQQKQAKKEADEAVADLESATRLMQAAEENPWNT